MGNVIAFRDPQADLRGEELEAALAVAREYAEAAAGAGLWHGLKLLSHAPGCERLGVEALLPVLAAAARRSWMLSDEEIDPRE